MPDADTESPQPPGQLTALERVSFLRDERDRHIELLEKLNFRISFGALVVLATAAFSADELASVRTGPKWLDNFTLALAIIGALCLIVSLVIHWNFRERRAKWCSQLIEQMMAGKTDAVAAKIVPPRTNLYLSLPPGFVFSWTLGTGVVSLLVAGAIFVINAT